MTIRQWLIYLALRALVWLSKGDISPYVNVVLPPEDQLPPTKGKKVCRHSFGLAGGYSKCTACGKGAVRG